MTAIHSRLGFAALAILVLAQGCANDRGTGSATPVTPDSAAAVVTALDTLRRLGAKDYVVDSLVRRGDTAIVWAGPRNWMATDRPTSAVSVLKPTRVVGVRQIMGG
jgi:hypothetical protein